MHTFLARQRHRARRHAHLLHGFDNQFAPYPATRIPDAVGDLTDPVNNENDTMFLVYRVTIVPAPASTGVLGLGVLFIRGRRRRPSSR